MLVRKYHGFECLEKKSYSVTKVTVMLVGGKGVLFEQFDIAETASFNMICYFIKMSVFYESFID